MHDHVRENFTGGPVSPADAGAAYGPGGAGGRAPGSLAAVARNQDALQAFMTGMAGGPTPKNKEVRANGPPPCRNVGTSWEALGLAEEREVNTRQQLGSLASGCLQVGFENFYGKAHAGKATVSHLTPEVNGLQVRACFGPPCSPLPLLSTTAHEPLAHTRPAPE